MRKLVAADKEVYVTIDSLNTISYTLASAATHINVTPTGSVNLIGLHSRRAYLKGLLDMVGVKADFIHIGDFKTAAETITRDGPSEEAMQMTGWLYDSLYDNIVTTLLYDKSGKGWGRGDATYACDIRTGNCTDFHSLFIGEARSLGIPARFIMGLPLPEGRSQGVIPGYHCWA